MRNISIANEFKWYALFVKTKNEFSVSNLLNQKLNIKTLVPSKRIWKKRDKEIKIIEKPLFNSYVFVNLNLWDKAWRKIYLCTSVFDIVRLSGQPASIPEDQVLSAAKVCESERPVHEMEHNSNLKPQDRVEVIDGPLYGAFGHFIKANKELGMFIVQVDLFQRSLVTELEASAVRPC